MLENIRNLKKGIYFLKYTNNYNQRKKIYLIFEGMRNINVDINIVWFWYSEAIKRRLYQNHYTYLRLAHGKNPQLVFVDFCEGNETRQLHG